MTNTEGDESVVEKSSVHDCNGICVNADFSWFVKLNKNVIYSGRRFLL